MAELEFKYLHVISNPCFFLLRSFPTIVTVEHIFLLNMQLLEENAAQWHARTLESKSLVAVDLGQVMETL